MRHYVATWMLGTDRESTMETSEALRTAEGAAPDPSDYLPRPADFMQAVVRSPQAVSVSGAATCWSTVTLRH